MKFAASALISLGEKHLIHRDLKPDNFNIHVSFPQNIDFKHFRNPEFYKNILDSNYNYEIKLIDFGLARSTEEALNDY